MPEFLIENLATTWQNVTLEFDQIT